MDLILDHTSSLEGIYWEGARSGWHLPLASSDLSGPQMVTYATIHYLHLLIDIRCPHIDPMFFLHHAVRFEDSSIKMVADVSVV